MFGMEEKKKIAMHKIETRAESLCWLIGAYDYARGSRVSWRKKSSYKKPMKRRISKLMRREQKRLLEKLIAE